MKNLLSVFYQRLENMVSVDNSIDWFMDVEEIKPALKELKEITTCLGAITVIDIMIDYLDSKCTIKEVEFYTIAYGMGDE